MVLDLSSWPGLQLGERLDTEHRRSVWMGTLAGELVAIRRLRGSVESVEWELALSAFLHASGVRVSEPIRTTAGKLHSHEVAVFRWLEGREPESESDWHAVAAELQRVHALTADYPQRPGCCAVTELRDQRKTLDTDIDALPLGVQKQVLTIFDQVGQVERAVVHGNTAARNIGITDDGRVGFFNWEKSRVDVVSHDLSNLGVQVLNDEDHANANILRLAWEIANSWILDTAYAEVCFSELREALSESSFN